ncbi:MAG: ATP-binding cassette domain-containing protein [Candidatus Omnitrophica bacterium]|nr:ATP-binding cassette domain-containing protein [Candidatus Omnitrophota bacterium]
MIRVIGLKKSFNSHLVLNGIDLEVEKNQIVSIIGESGSGKSVFLKLIMGFLQPDEGKIFINGTDINSLDERKLLQIRKNIGYLFQESALFDFMTVYDNLAFPLRENTDLSEFDIKKRIKDSLSRVELHDVENKTPEELSGGMKKRIGIARAIIMEPKIFLCDEPTAGLDPNKSLSIMRLISDLARSLKSASIIVSHDVSNVLRFSDIIALLYNGKLITKGTKEEIFKTNQKEAREFLMLDS